jgi:hypothetical protein
MYLSSALVAAGDELVAFGILYCCAVSGSCVGIWLHLQFVWRFMAETDEGIFDVPWHGEMNLAHSIVPIKHESKVLHSFPVSVDCEVLFQYANEMLDIILVDVLHAEIVDDECKINRAPVVSPVPWRDLALLISGFVELPGEEVLRYDASLGEAVHPTLHFTEDIAICVHLVAESVFIMISGRNNSNFISSSLGNAKNYR